MRFVLGYGRAPPDKQPPVVKCRLSVVECLLALVLQELWMEEWTAQ